MEKNSIWIICDGEKFDDELILQLVNKGYQLHLINHAKLVVVYMGTQQPKGMKVLEQYGVEKVIYTECHSDDSQIRCELLSQMVRRYEPKLLLFPASREGKYMAAVISTEFESGLVAECIDIELDASQEYMFSRAALNSSIVAQIKCINSKLNLCTVKKNVFTIEEHEAEQGISIEHFDSELSESQGICNTGQLEVLSQIDHSKSNNMDWQSAKFVFAIGRGVSNQDTVERIRRLATRYGAELIGTRAAVEEGLIDQNRQVGQSAVSICPHIYVGFGISGASQHIVGIKNAKLIIAINKDENAPIFQYADYAVVADIQEVIDELDAIVIAKV